MLSVSRVLKIRDKIFESLHEYIGVKLVGAVIDQFIKNIILSLPREFHDDNNVYVDLFECIRYLIGTELSYDAIRSLCWHISGNISSIRSHEWSIYHLSNQRHLEWCPMQIVKARKYTKDEKLYFYYDIRILAGSTCPLITYKSWSSKACYRMARMMGFTASWGNYPFTDGLELVSLRFSGLLDPELSIDRPSFKETKCSSSLKNWNRKVMKMRQREDFQCPEKYTVPCYLCWHGYNFCPAACRPKDLIKKFCFKCNNESWFNPDDTSNTCIDCL